MVTKKDNEIEYVSATDLKRNTGRLLDKVRYGGVKLIVEKNNRPYVEITPTTLVNRPKKEEIIKRYFGIWKNDDWKKLDEYRKEFKNNFSVIN